MVGPGRRLLIAWVAGLSACAPTLDWRDVRSSDGAVKLQFPCRPDVQVRAVGLVGAPVPLTLQVCSAGGLSFGLAQADMADPARVGPALAALQAGSAANVGSPPAGVSPQPVPGATPQAGAGRVRLSGHRPDGAEVHLHALVFARGTTAFQATVLGDQAAEAAAEAYFGSIRIDP